MNATAFTRAVYNILPNVWLLQFNGLLTFDVKQAEARTSKADIHLLTSVHSSRLFVRHATSLLSYKFPKVLSSEPDITAL